MTIVEPSVGGRSKMRLTQHCPGKVYLSWPRRIGPLSLFLFSLFLLLYSLSSYLFGRNKTTKTGRLYWSLFLMLSRRSWSRCCASLPGCCCSCLGLGCCFSWLSRLPEPLQLTGRRTQEMRACHGQPVGEMYRNKYTKCPQGALDGKRADFNHHQERPPRRGLHRVMSLLKKRTLAVSCTRRFMVHLHALPRVFFFLPWHSRVPATLLPLHNSPSLTSRCRKFLVNILVREPHTATSYHP